MRTVVLSDLHLGALSGRAVLGVAEIRRRLLEAVAGAGRVVLLGDVIELRERTIDDGVHAAEPLFADLGDALGDAEVVLVPGNHDHPLTQPLLDEIGGPERLCRLEHSMTPAASDPLGVLARRLGRARLTLAYPGVWLADGVYATHGHYMDVHSTVPTFECLAIAGLARAAGGVPAPGASPADYERLVGPVYRGAVRLGQAAVDATGGGGADLSVRVWERLAANGADRSPAGGDAAGAPLRVRLLAGAIPAAVGAVNRLGLGPFRTDLSGPALRRSGLRSIAEAVRRLEIEADHVVFGHTHRSGPLAGDDESEWTPPGGVRLTNVGCWIYEPAFAGERPGASPYWPGNVVEIDEGGPPRLRPLLLEVEADQLWAGA